MRYRPPFEVTPRVLSSVAEIMRLTGRYEGLLQPKPQPKLRRDNRIRTIVGTLAIEGNTLSDGQVTAILEKKRVVGPRREILEVKNAIATYERAPTFSPGRINDLLAAHASMMKGLIPDAGRFRSKGVGIVQGSRVAHVAPPAARVPTLIRQLFAFLRTERLLEPLVLSAIVHYELEFIHPFSDGNGRIGRLWQHVLLIKRHPVFQFLPIESAIFTRQPEYYRVLAECDRAGNSSRFIEFSLATVHESLEQFLREIRPEPVTSEMRLEVARRAFKKDSFSRKDYLGQFVNLSTATASRDLRQGVDERMLVKSGDKAQTRYRFR